MRLAELIHAEVAAAGPISLARFMELALYHPEHGYYTQPERPIGRAGDFFTSVSVGRLFGELLALRFAGWLECLAGAVQIVEAGAHDGRLAADLLPALDRLAPSRRGSVEYWIIEPFPHRRASQARTLASWRGRVRWFADWSELPAPVQGVIFGNEVLDAMPVHRWEWDASGRAWREVGVGIGAGGFRWTRLEDGRSEAVPPTPPAGLETVLPEGYVAETSPRAEGWWARAAASLGRGWLLALDYGDDDWERWSPHRRDGTLRAYRHHRLADHPLADPGLQDMTAHVDFARLRAAGEAAGVRTVALEPQHRFLSGIVAEPAAKGGAALRWTSARRRQLATLLHPQFLGRSFRVLIQQR